MSNVTISFVNLKTGNLNWRLNHQIEAPSVRVIDSDGKQLGVMKLQDALAKAEEEGLDLVEIAHNAKPPVAKIVELGKFKYEQDKRLQKQKKGGKASEIKEVRFSPFIAEHDYQNRIEKIKEFLNDRQKVRTVVKFTGRQMQSKDFGYKVFDKILADLSDSVTVDMEPKFLGRHLIMVISPTSKTKAAAKKESEQEDAKS